MTEPSPLPGEHSYQRESGIDTFLCETGCPYGTDTRHETPQAGTIGLSSFPELQLEFSDIFDSQYQMMPNDDASQLLPTFGLDDRSVLMHNTAQLHSLTAVPTALSSREQSYLAQHHTHHNSTLSSDDLQAHRQTAPMQQLSSTPRARPTHHAPFSGMFHDSQSASEFRKTALRFNRVSNRPPECDQSIQELEDNRQYHVGRIYNGMVSSDMAKDNPGSIAMRRWAQSDFYPSNLVEAYAHKVFDYLIEQAQYGFRGWHHNDYASDDRKGEPEDKSVSCAERLDNIIQAVEEEKTICEDIMTSACQIRMFVNAPRAYARRKEANRHGNSKRGRTTSANTRITKNKRANPRVATRASAPISSPAEDHALPNLDVQAQTSQQGPYYNGAQAHPARSRAVSQPVPELLSDRPHEISPPPLSMDHMGLMSPDLPHMDNQRFTPVALPRESPFLSPPPLTLASAPATPETISGVRDGFSSMWSPMSTSNSYSHSTFHGRQSAFDAATLPFSSSNETARTFDNMQFNGDFAPNGLPACVNPGDLNIDPNLTDFKPFWNG